MKQDDVIMRELHQIRETHYEETKNMSPEELLAFDTKRVNEIKKKYSIDLPRMQKAS